MLPPRIADGGLTVERIYQLSRTCWSAAAARAPSCRAASSRCWRSEGRILRTGGKALVARRADRGGLPRVIVQQIGATIRELKKEGFTIVLVRAEPALRRIGCRPALRGRAGPGDRHDPEHRTRRQYRQAARLSGRCNWLKSIAAFCAYN